MRHFLSRFFAALAHRGGVANTLRRASEVHRREGWPGIVLRLRRVSSTVFDVYGRQQSYLQWLEEFFPSSIQRHDQLRGFMRNWNYQPLISIVVPVYNPRLDWLIQAIDSVRHQIYPHWEICLADDASTHPKVRMLLSELSKEDPRIRVVFRPVNGHISAATNSAISLAQGDYLGFLDQDDLLAAEALFWIVQALQESPRPKFLFSDEDKVDENGKRFTPFFKCDLNRELLLSQNMVTHFAVYESRLIESLGGCRIGFEGAQDYDLTLRAIDALPASAIVHIPRVLYHWRLHRDSTAGSAKAKPYALMAAKAAIEEHLQRNAETAQVATNVDFGICHVSFDCPNPPPLVSILIPTRNAFELLSTCIESIRKLTAYPAYEIVVIDNGSNKSDALCYFERLSRQDGCRVIRDDRPFNFSALNNRAAESAHGSILVLLNNDTEVIQSDWLDILVSQASRPCNGVVGAKLLYPDRRVQHAGVVLGIGDCAGHLHHGLEAHDMGYFSRAALTQNFSAVTAACFAVRKEIYIAAGGLNEQQLAIAFNDIDFCLKVQSLGYRNVWAADCVLIHHESVSRGFENTPEKIERFRHEVAYMQSRWGHIIWNDPCYSPNLTLEGMHCQLANPPRVPALPLPNQSTAKVSSAIRYGLVIPTKNAGPRWELVLASLKKQQGLAPEVLVVDSGSTDHTNRLTRLSGYRCVEIAPQLFSHGKTRQQALEQLNCDIVFFLTQDAVLATPTSLLELSSAFDDPQVAVAYGRQLPRPDAKFSDWMLRRFNYPAQSAVRSFDDRKRLGLRCAFNSNSFSAYRVSALLAVGGFDAEIPVGEDIVACAALLQAGYTSAYVAHSYVIHSHNYRLAEEFERYRQIGQMHKMRPELLETFGRPEGEGFRLVVSELKAAFRISLWAVLSSLARAAVKYLGYRRGVMS